MKQKYQPICITIEQLPQEDIITASGTPQEHENSYVDFFEDLFDF